MMRINLLGGPKVVAPTAAPSAVAPSAIVIAPVFLGARSRRVMGLAFLSRQPKRARKMLLPFEGEKRTGVEVVLPRAAAVQQAEGDDRHILL